MARPKKQTVDYFPHAVHHGKTMFVLENTFGNDGYAFWFKLLELLGAAEGHVFDYNSPSDWRFLLAKTRVNEEICEQILKTLADLNAIDRELYEEKKIWVQNFVDGVEDVYARRKIEKPQKPTLCQQKPSKGSQKPTLCETTGDTQGVYDNDNPQSKVKKSKVKKSKHKYGEFVSLTKEEYETLVSKYGETTTQKMIEVLDNYKGAKGKQYKSDYRAILSWVVDKVNAQAEKEGGYEPQESEAFKRLKAKRASQEQDDGDGI